MTDVPPTGEAVLWRAVVLQAFKDATFGLHNSDSDRKPRKPSSDRIKLANAARDWLLGNSSDFRRVCDCAGLHPTYVMKSAVAAIAKADGILKKSERKAKNSEDDSATLRAQTNKSHQAKGLTTEMGAS